MAKATKKKASKKKKKPKRKPAKPEVGYGRTSKDGTLVAVNIYIHRKLLALLDKSARTEQRSRRRQLQIAPCKAFSVDPSTL